MSNVSNRHSFVKLEKNSKPLSGQRLVRLIAKQSKDGSYASPNLTQSLCVSVPPVSLDDIQANIDALVPHLVSMVEEAQNELIREYRITNGHESIDESEFGIAKCIEFLDSSAKGSRLTTEYLQAWFVETYNDAAVEYIATALKLNVDELSEADAKQVGDKANVLRDMFAGFASARYSPDIPRCKAMMKFGEFLGEGNADARMMQYLGKAAKIRAEKEKELSMDALGF